MTHQLRLILILAFVSTTFVACGKSMNSNQETQPILSIQSIATKDFAGLTPQPTAEESSSFWKYWGDGKGEVDSYKVTQSRYGELRQGYSVLIYVTEVISRNTRIKVESDKIPKDDRVPVLKLNRVVKFPTGIYDYSLLTSIFDAIGPELGNHPFQSLKVSTTVQEWCGSFFGMWHTNTNGLNYTRHSYFESEGDEDNVHYDIPKDEWEYEDNLPILIRDLDGDWMKTGDSKNIALLPSFQHQRFTHDSIGFVPATVIKRVGEGITIAGKKYDSTIHWQWMYTEAKTKITEDYWVESTYPHRIVKWESSDGSNGELLVSQRLPYWSLHDNAHAYLRKDFIIPEN